MQKHVYGITNNNYVLLDTVKSTLAAVMVKKKYRKVGFDNLIITDKPIQETKTSKIIIL